MLFHRRKVILVDNLYKKRNDTLRKYDVCTQYEACFDILKIAFNLSFWKTKNYIIIYIL